MNQIIAGVLIIQNGEYVVQKRDNIPNIAEPGMITTWGGAAEEGEDPKTAAVRELVEETGIEADEQDLTLVTKIVTHGRSPEFVGSDIDVYIYALELSPEVEVHCYEGEKAVRFSKLEEALEAGEKPNDLLTQAIESYESKA